MSTYGHRRKSLHAMYRAMLGHFGPSDWWPADSPFEVAVGAVLTQNTAWRNVEKALDNLRAATGLIPARLAALPPEEVAELVRPAGFFTQKSATLQRFMQLMRDYGAFFDGTPVHDADDTRLVCFANTDDAALREALLAVRGIGPETADCIVLYALERPSFVVDAYTRRIFHRHAMVEEAIDYHELRDFFMDALEADTALYNEYHALIVRTGKDYCSKARPKCAACPLREFLDHEPA